MAPIVLCQPSGNQGWAGAVSLSACANSSTPAYGTVISQPVSPMHGLPADVLVNILKDLPVSTGLVAAVQDTSIL